MLEPDLEGYSVGPGARRLLRNYWRRLTMAARSGGYYGAAVKGERGVTQGDPLSPTLFNVVVDAVVRHWLEGLQAAKEEKGAKGCMHSRAAEIGRASCRERV